MQWRLTYTHAHVNSQFLTQTEETTSSSRQSDVFTLMPQLEQWCHHHLNRNNRVVRRMYLLTIIYTIVQTRVITWLFPWLSPDKVLFDSSATPLSCCSYPFVLAFSGSAGTLQNFLMGRLKIAQAGSVLGWFMRLWVIQLCRNGMTAEE